MPSENDVDGVKAVKKVGQLGTSPTGSQDLVGGIIAVGPVVLVAGHPVHPKQLYKALMIFQVGKGEYSLKAPIEQLER